MALHHEKSGDGRRRKQPGPWAVQLLQVILLHGMVWLLAEHLFSSKEPDLWQTPLIISLASEPPLSAFPDNEAPPAEPPEHSPPPKNAKEKGEGAQTAKQQPPPTDRVPPVKRLPKEQGSTGNASHIKDRSSKFPPQPVPQGTQNDSLKDEEKGQDAPARKSPAYIQPRAVHNPPPEYPQRARARGWQGTVMVEVLIDASGGVRETRLSTTSGHDLLDQAALVAVGHWRFQPGRQDGKKVAMRVRIPVHFQLE